MRFKAIAVGMVMMLAGTAGAKERQSAFTIQSKPLHATVTILAVSSSSRQSFAGNQEIYLADVHVKGGEHQFARLLDQYPGYGLPIRQDLLHEGAPLSMQVTREPECDVPASEIYLSQGQGTIYNASVRDSLQSHRAQPVPCFKTLHQTIKTAKK